MPRRNESARLDFSKLTGHGVRVAIVDSGVDQNHSGVRRIAGGVDLSTGPDGRILFGTDLVKNELSSTLSPEQRQERTEDAERRFRMEFSYYESTEQLTIAGRQVEGLGLSREILEHFYHGNAERWYPGI